MSIIEEMETYYETIEKAKKGQIRSCFNCKHAVYTPATPFFEAEADCTNKKALEAWNEIEQKIEQYPDFEYKLEYYIAMNCPFYEALTDEERARRFSE